MATQPKKQGAAQAAPAPAPVASKLEAVAEVRVVLAVNTTVLHGGARLSLRAGEQLLPQDLADLLRADGLLVD